MEHIKTKDDFEELIHQNKNVVIDFYATWCGPCKMLSPVMENVANESKNVKVVKVDVDDASELAEMFGIRSVPTIVYIKEKSLADRQIGFRTKEQILESIEKLF